MKKCFLLLLVVLTHAQCYCQQKYVSEKDVYTANEIIFYGYDFSRLRLNEAKRMGEDMTQQIYSWVSFCAEHITDEKLTAWFRKEKVRSNLTPTVERAKKINGKEVVTFTKSTLSKDSLQSIINQFVLTEKEGLGLTVILECFDKPSKITSGYFVFFDISTRQILLADYFSGKEADGYGLTNYWGISVVGTTKNYASSFRKKMKQ